MSVCKVTRIQVPEKLKEKASFYGSYNDNGCVEFDSFTLAVTEKIDFIFGVSEADVVRVEALKELIGLPGIGSKNAFVFRNKVLMKETASKAHISVPKYEGVHQPFDLLRFINKHGYPVVFKPISGSGGTNTYIVKDEEAFKSVLNSSHFNYKEASARYIVEDFVEGDMFHIDGIVSNGEVILSIPSVYRSSCLSFQDGQAISSLMLDHKNPFYSLLNLYSQTVCDAFPFPSISPFHIEVFMTPDKKLVFCEVACRSGGGAIMEAIETAIGVNISNLVVLAQLDENLLLGLANKLEEKQQQYAGWILIPPIDGILQKLPQKTPFNFVSQYLVNATPGSVFRKGEKAADNILQVVISSSSQTSLEERMGTVEDWLSNEIVWSY